MARRADRGERSGTGEIPPPLELTCLGVLWKQGECAVGEVQQALQPKRPLAYTTVMTVLERLARKGMVTRRKVGRSFRYSAARERDRVRAQALSQLVQQLFDGSSEELARFLRTHGADLGLSRSPEPSGMLPGEEREDPQGDPPRFGSLDTSLL